MIAGQLLLGGESYNVLLFIKTHCREEQRQKYTSKLKGRATGSLTSYRQLRLISFPPQVNRRGSTILDKKMEQQTPIPPPPPQIKDEAAQKPKRAIFPSLIWRGGGLRFSIYFVQDCRINVASHGDKNVCVGVQDKCGPISKTSTEGASLQRASGAGMLSREIVSISTP